MAVIRGEMTQGDRLRAESRHCYPSGPGKEFCAPQWRAAGREGRAETQTLEDKVMSTRIGYALTLLAALMLALPLAGCGGGEKKDPRKKKARKKTTTSASAKKGDYGPAGGKVDLAQAGSIKGRIKFTGEARKPAKVDISKDKWCADNHEVFTEETLVDANGGLKNVIAYLEGLEGMADSFDMPSKPARLVQQGCKYIPHVLTVRVGQDLEVVNADDTSHNYHFIGRRNDEINKTQPEPTTDLVKFDSPEVNARFGCDIHGWMQCKVHIFDHPCYAVTMEDGSFEIPSVPPGKYRLVFSHERQKMAGLAREITVGAKENKDLGEISFGG